MRSIHQWKSENGPPIGLEYVPHAWGYSRCKKCSAVRFFHDSGPKGGTYVTITWPRGHTAAMPGVPLRYITNPVGVGAQPPCIHAVRLVRAAAVLLGVLLASVAGAQTTDAPKPRVSDFGRMFAAPAFQPPDDLLVALAASMRDPNAPENDNPARTPSGMTYLGQFLDHDLTLDATPLEDANDVDQLTNGRTAALDLDSVFGKGPEGSPELYDSAGRFVFAQPNGFSDFQRDPITGKAVIAEGRNDENMVIAQIHLAVQKFHNRLVNGGASFEDAQRLTRWHWQWVVVHEFLPEIAGQATVDRYLGRNGAGKPKFKGENYTPGNRHSPMMPVEFSVAAYRFGHSMVRLAYVMPTNSITKTQVFNAAGNDLRGSRVIPPEKKIDFNNFFSTPGQPEPPGRNVSRRIDSLLSAGLFLLPVGVAIPPTQAPVISLAERNLLRAKRLGLPSYQDVAVEMGLTPLTNAELGLTDPGWGGKAPLWYGILKESEVREAGVKLGPVGARIVAEVILALIDADKDSYFSTPQAWSPPGGDFRVADLLGAQ